jgi:hypothetical protein
VLAYRLHQRRRSLRPPPPRGRGTAYVRYKLITSPDNSEAQRRLAVAGFRAHERKLLLGRWRDLRAAWQAGTYRAIPRQLAAAAVPLAAYARGRPWRWQR